MGSNDTDLKAKFGKILKENDIPDEIAQVTISKPNLCGEHMGSVIELARLDFEKDGTPPLELFLKKRIPPCGNALMDSGMIEIMLKEGTFLKEFTPKLEKLCVERSKGSKPLTSELFPKTYYYDEEVIIMENLTKQGYILLPKKEKQDFQTATAVMHHLAKLHAVSFVLIENAGGSTKFLESNPIFQETMIKRDSPMIGQAFEPAFKIAMELIKKCGHEEKDEKYELLSKYEGKLLDTMCDVIEAENLFYSVLHGDCHNNNMMFNQTTNKVVLVDFQISRIGSPNLDLAYFLFTSTKPEVRKRWKELLQIYFDSFKSNVVSLGHPFELKFEEFVKDFRRKSKLGFLFGFFTIIFLEAIGNHDTSKDSKDDFSEVFSKMMNKWVEDNPDKVENSAAAMISIINDYLLVAQL